MKLRSFFAGLLLLSATSFVFGQGALPDMGASRDTGVRPYTAFGGVNENINLMNGNLNLTVPLLHLRGRNGFDLNLSLFYNSKIWNLHGGYDPAMDIITVSWGADITHQPWLDIANGWKLGIPTMNYVTTWSGQSTDDCEGQIIITLSDGAKSVFNNRYGCDTYGSSQSPIFPIDADDSTGMRLTDSGSDLLVSLRNGTKVHFSYGGGVATKMVDASGNVISFTQSGTQVIITDTVGRIVTVNTTSSLITITYRNSNSSGPTDTRTVSVALGSGSVTPNCSFTYPIQNIHQYPPMYVSHRTICSGLTSQLLSVTIPTADTSHPQVYSFDYNSFAELSKITYPTGGYTKYSYGAPTHLESSVMLTEPEDGTVTADFREVVERRVCRNANGSCTSGEDVTTYTPTVSTSLGYNQFMDVRDPLGNRTRHEFVDGVIPGDSAPVHQGMSPHEINVFYYSGESTLLKTVHTVYDDIYAWSLPTSVTTTLNDASPNLVKQETFTYDTRSVLYLPYPSVFGSFPSAATATRDIDNVLTHVETDWGSGSAGSTLRSTVSTWVKTNAVYGSGTAVDYFSNPVRILSLKATEKTYDGSTLKAETDYEYDKSSLTAPTTASIQQETPVNGNARGKVTKVKRWLDTNNTWPYSTYSYYDSGNVYQATDTGGHTTTFDWSDNWGNATCAPSAGAANAYLKKITNALGQYTMFVNNSCTGTLYSVTDPNSQTTSYTYDAMDRLATTTLPVTGSDSGGSTNSYSELGAATGHGFYVTSSTKQDSTSGHNMVTETEIDGIGRVVHTRLMSDPQGTVYTDTTYDTLGRTYTVSNPYRSGNTVFNTYTQYDALGRVIYLTKQDGSYTSDYYSGNNHVAYDEAGHGRIYYTDGIGRMYHVVEPKYDGSSWAYNAWYTYDVLGNLLSVNQAGDGTGTARNRTFEYDSLSQLTKATNPESGTICYGTMTGSTCNKNGYDVDGNLIYKTDARGIRTTNSYDALHRVLLRVYSNSEPSKSWLYDVPDSGKPSTVTVTNPVGRLVRESNNVNAAAYYSYDAMGRVVNQYTYLPSYYCASGYGWCNATTASYNLAGGLTSLTYPSGRVVNNSYDSATNQYSDVNASFSGTAYHYYKPTSFLPSGVAGAVNLGNGTNEVNTLNSRLQPCKYELKLSSIFLIDRRNRYGSATSDCANYSVSSNNGNVMSVVDGVNSNKTQTFAYDYLNRITSAATTATSGSDAWAQTFTYDPWGNLQQHGSKAFEVGVNTNNQIYDSAHSGYYVHDAAGNMTHSYDGVTTHDFVFDAESQVTSIDSHTTDYVYDAEGQRVRKTTGSNYTEYIYFSGQPIAERDQAGAWTDYIFAGGKRVAMATGTTSSGTKYYHGDHLGSARLMTDASGAVVSGSEATYLPFGWEWNAPTTPPTHYKFTGKERDEETKNDYFGARYYNGSMGRWLSPDWSASPEPVPYADLSDPQSLNLYGYVRNRPTFAVDKDGHCFWDVCIGEVYVAAAVTVAAAAYLSTPQGKKSTQAAIEGTLGLGGEIVDGINSLSDKLRNVINSESGDKTVPNPNGSKGAPDHQQTADEEAAKMGPNGQREVRVQTPGGEKGSRVIDAAKVEDGKVTQATQVVRPNKDGTPPAREVRAAADIQKATGVQPKLVPVRPIKKPDGQ